MPPETNKEQTRVDAEALIRELEGKRDARCGKCGRAVCSHQALMGIAMGFKGSSQCVSCLARFLEREPRVFRDSVYAYIQARECFRAAWDWAGRVERVEGEGIPDCVGGAEDGGAAATEAGDGDYGNDGSDGNDGKVPAGEWDAGEMGCGDLVLELRTRLQGLRPGAVFKLRARDPGAPEDLPAWCRLTGHRLLRSDHPEYWIQRKE